VGVDSDWPEAGSGVHLLRRIRGVSGDNDRAGTVAPALEHAMVDERRRQTTMAKPWMRKEVLYLAGSIDAAP